MVDDETNKNSADDSVTKKAGSADSNQLKKPSVDGPAAKDSAVKQTTSTKHALDDSLVTIMNRREFYRDNFHRSMMINLLMILSNVILGFLIVYLLFNKPAPKYFVTTPDGRILPITPLNEPLKSTPQVLAWSNTSAVLVNSYDFLNYRQQLQTASNNFTPDGWDAYKKVLVDSKNLEYVVKNKFVTTAVATGAPIVLKQGLLQGKYTWKVQLPLLIKYQSASQQQNQPLTITMLIQRVSLQTNSQGIGIVYYQAQG